MKISMQDGEDGPIAATFTAESPTDSKALRFILEGLARGLPIRVEGLGTIQYSDTENPTELKVFDGG